MLRKLWINIRFIFGFGYYVVGTEKGVTRHVRTYSEAIEWACKGFYGELVNIYSYDGGYRFIWEGSYKCTCCKGVEV